MQKNLIVLNVNDAISCVIRIDSFVLFCYRFSSAIMQQSWKKLISDNASHTHELMRMPLLSDDYHDTKKYSEYALVILPTG